MPETTGTIMDFDWLLELLIGWVQNIQKSKLLNKISSLIKNYYITISKQKSAQFIHLFWRYSRFYDPMT